MNKLTLDRRAAVVRSLIEGTSIRSAGRATGTDKDTVTRILVEVGEFCSLYQHHALRNLPCRVVEADEIWSFVGAKAANRTNDKQHDIWTFVALCADTKLAASWFVGERNWESTLIFLRDLRDRMAGRIQLSTDQWIAYEQSVRRAFGKNGVDYAQIKKVYGGANETRGRGSYSPSPVVVEVEKVPLFGEPDLKRVSTSYVERSNLSMRMGMRRFTRLTNAFSRKAENHAHAVSLHFMAHNYIRAHGTLTKRAKGIKTTPAMLNGLTDHVWTVEEMLSKMETTYEIGASNVSL